MRTKQPFAPVADTKPDTTTPLASSLLATLASPATMSLPDTRPAIVAAATMLGRRESCSATTGPRFVWSCLLDFLLGLAAAGALVASPSLSGASLSESLSASPSESESPAVADFCFFLGCAGAARFSGTTTPSGHSAVRTSSTAGMMTHRTIWMMPNQTTTTHVTTIHKPTTTLPTQQSAAAGTDG